MYEREPSPDARAQGDVLDLHAETGQQALCKASPAEEFHAFESAGGGLPRSTDGANSRGLPLLTDTRPHTAATGNSFAVHRSSGRR